MAKQLTQMGTGNKVFEDFDENTNWQLPDEIVDCVIQLTEEQANYLANWEEGKCSLESEQAFIESLQQLVLSMVDNK